MSKLYYIIEDIDKIHDFIFQTGKLKEIRGASAILADFNDFENVDKRVQNSGGKLIYAGGGTVKAYFDNESTNNALKNAQEFILNEVKKLREISKTASLTGIIEETTEDEFKNKFIELNLKAERKLRKHKESKHFNSHILNNPFIKFCDSCRTLPATCRDTMDNSILCDTCYTKRQHSKPNRIFEKFRNWLREKLKDNPVSGWDIDKLKNYNNDTMMKDKDITDIGDKSNNYIGMIYCDGNRIGQRLRDVGTTPDEYKEFSKLIKESVENTIFEVIVDRIKPDNNCYVPVEFILIGGDDLVIIVPANKAIEIAQEFCKEFHKKTESKGKEVSMSAGIAIAHSKFPFYRLYKVAEGLVRSAKKLSNNLKDNTIEASCIDFTVISTSSTSSVEMVRSKEYTCKDNEDFYLYRRPYIVYDTKTQTDELEDLIEVIKTFKNIGFPKTKLNQFYQILFSRDKDHIHFESWLLRSRLNKRQRNVFDALMRDKLMLSNFPWCEINEKGKTIYKTPLSDIVEIYDFIE